MENINIQPQIVKKLKEVRKVAETTNLHYVMCSWIVPQLSKELNHRVAYFEGYSDMCEFAKTCKDFYHLLDVPYFVFTSFDDVDGGLLNYENV